MRTIKQVQLDRTLFELLRLQAVAATVLPDYTSMTSAQYDAAKAVIRQTKNVVEVFGVGTDDSKDVKSVCKIVISQGAVTPSPTIGGGTQYYREYEDAGNDRFESLKRPNTPKRLEYRIRVVAATMEDERVIQDIIFAALGSDRKYVNEWKLDNTGFESYEDKPLLFFNGKTDTGGGQFVEKLYSYVFDDVWIDSSEVIRTNIVPISTIEYLIAVVENADPMTTAPVETDKNVDKVTITEN